MEVVVNGCEKCCFCCSSYDEFSMGSAWTHTCNLLVLRSYEENRSDVNYFIEVKENEEGEDILITPSHCPLKEEKAILISWRE